MKMRKFFEALYRIGVPARFLNRWWLYLNEEDYPTYLVTDITAHN